MASGDLRSSERRSIPRTQEGSLLPRFDCVDRKKKMCNQKLENYVVGIFLFGFFFFFLEWVGFFPPPLTRACRNSGTRDQTHGTAVIRATAVTVLDP